MHIFLFLFLVAATFREGSTGACTAVDLTNDTAILLSLDLVVTCTSTNMQASINTCVLDQMQHTITSDFAMVGYNSSVSGYDHTLDVSSSCRGTPGSDTLAITTGFTECVTHMEDDGTFITYSNAIRTIAFTDAGSNVIVRRRDILLPFSCRYSKVTNESSTIYLEPFIGSNVAAPVVETGSFDITVNLCEDSSCSVKYSSGDAVEALEDLIYVEVSTTHSDLIIEIIDIWATKTSMANAAPFHMLLHDRCSADVPYVSIISNRVGDKAVICFHAFDWVDGSSDMYIHVEVSTCDNSREAACTVGLPTCPSRKRRNVKFSSSIGQIITATAGHLTIAH